MELKFFAGRRGDVIARLPDGKIALPRRGGPVPQDGDIWEVVPDGQTPSGTAVIVDLVRRVSTREERRRAEEEEWRRAEDRLRARAPEMLRTLVEEDRPLAFEGARIIGVVERLSVLGNAEDGMRVEVAGALVGRAREATIRAAATVTATVPWDRLALRSADTLVVRLPECEPNAWETPLPEFAVPDGWRAIRDAMGATVWVPCARIGAREVLGDPVAAALARVDRGGNVDLEPRPGAPAALAAEVSAYAERRRATLAGLDHAGDWQRIAKDMFDGLERAGLPGIALAPWLGMGGVPLADRRLLRALRADGIYTEPILPRPNEGGSEWPEETRGSPALRGEPWDRAVYERVRDALIPADAPTSLVLPRSAWTIQNWPRDRLLRSAGDLEPIPAGSYPGRVIWGQNHRGFQSLVFQVVLDLPLVQRRGLGGMAWSRVVGTERVAVIVPDDDPGVEWKRPTFVDRFGRKGERPVIEGRPGSLIVTDRGDYLIRLEATPEEEAAEAAEAARLAAEEERKRQMEEERRDREALLWFRRVAVELGGVFTGWRYRADADEYAGWLVIAFRDPDSRGREQLIFRLLDPSSWTIAKRKGYLSNITAEPTAAGVAEAMRRWRDGGKPIEPAPEYRAMTPLASWLEEGV